MDHFQYHQTQHALQRLIQWTQQRFLVTPSSHWTRLINDRTASLSDRDVFSIKDTEVGLWQLWTEGSLSCLTYFCCHSSYYAYHGLHQYSALRRAGRDKRNKRQRTKERKKQAKKKKMVRTWSYQAIKLCTFPATSSPSRTGRLPCRALLVSFPSSCTKPAHPACSFLGPTETMLFSGHVLFALCQQYVIHCMRLWITIN